MIIALHNFHKVDGFEQTPLVLGRNSIDGHDRSHRLEMTWWWDRSHWCVCRWMLEDDPSWKAGVSEPLLKFHPPHPQKLFIDSDLNWIQQTQIWYTTHKSTVYHCRHCAIYQFAILYFLAPKMHGYPDHLKVSPIAEMSMLMDLALDKVGKPGLWAFQDLPRKACHLLCRHIVHVFSCLVVSNMRVSVFTMVHLRAY